MGNLTRKQTDLSSDKSHRMPKRPSSQSVAPNHRQLSQAPGQGQIFEDVGGSFGNKLKSQTPAKRSKRVVCSEEESEDELDMLSSQATDPMDELSQSNAKGKAKQRTRANGGGSWASDGKSFNESYTSNVKSLPKITKIKFTPSTASTTRASSPDSQKASKPARSIASSMRPKEYPKPGSPERPILRLNADAKTRPQKQGQDRTSTRSASPPARAGPRPKPRPIKKPSQDIELIPPGRTNAPPRKKPSLNPQPFPVSPPADSGTDIESPATARPNRKGPAPFPMESMSPLAGKSNREQGGGVQSSSSFPDISPLRSNSKPKDIFPHISPLSSPARGGDPPRRPFPLASPIANSTKRLSEEVEDGRAKNGKKRREEKDRNDDDMCVLHVLFLLLNKPDVT